MMLPVFAEDANVVHEAFEFFDATEYHLHGFLGKIGRALDTHRQSAVAVLAEGCNDGTQVLGLVVELKCVKLHCDVELGEEGIARALGKNMLDARKQIHTPMDHLVQGTKVGNNSNATIFLGDSKGWSCPVGRTTWFKDTDLDKLIDLMSKYLLMVVHNGVRSRIDGLGIWIDFKMNFPVWIEPKLARKQLWKLRKEFGKVSMLFWSQMGLLVGDVIGVGFFVLAFKDLLAHGVGVEVIDCSRRVVLECSSRARVVHIQLEQYRVVEPTDFLHGAIDDKSNCCTEVGAKDHVVLAR
jgi:hypothetical protein